MTKSKRRVANARPGSFQQIAQLPKDCRWARARMRGWNDYAKGKGFRDSYDLWSTKAQYAYERGRLQACLTLRVMTLLARPGDLPEWRMDELVNAPMFRALGDFNAVNKILEETRAARRVARKAKKEKEK